MGQCGLVGNHRLVRQETACLFGEKPPVAPGCQQCGPETLWILRYDVEGLGAYAPCTPEDCYVFYVGIQTIEVFYRRGSVYVQAPVAFKTRI